MASTHAVGAQLRLEDREIEGLVAKLGGVVASRRLIPGLFERDNDFKVFPVRKSVTQSDSESDTEIESYLERLSEHQGHLGPEWSAVDPAGLSFAQRKRVVKAYGQASTEASTLFGQAKWKETEARAAFNATTGSEQLKCRHTLLEAQASVLAADLYKTQLTCMWSVLPSFQQETSPDEVASLVKSLFAIEPQMYDEWEKDYYDKNRNMDTYVLASGNFETLSPLQAVRYMVNSRSDWETELANNIPLKFMTCVRKRDKFEPSEPEAGVVTGLAARLRPTNARLSDYRSGGENDLRGTKPLWEDDQQSIPASTSTAIQTQATSSKQTAPTTVVTKSTRKSETRKVHQSTGPADHHAGLTHQEQVPGRFPVLGREYAPRTEEEDGEIKSVFDLGPVGATGNERRRRRAQKHLLAEPSPALVSASTSEDHSTVYSSFDAEKVKEFLARDWKKGDLSTTIYSPK